MISPCINCWICSRRSQSADQLSVTFGWQQIVEHMSVVSHYLLEECAWTNVLVELVGPVVLSLKQEKEKYTTANTHLHCLDLCQQCIGKFRLRRHVNTSSYVGYLNIVFIVIIGMFQAKTLLRLVCENVDKRTW